MKQRALIAAGIVLLIVVFSMPLITRALRDDSESDADADLFSSDPRNESTPRIVITDVDVLEPEEYETEVAGLKPCDVLSEGENVQTLESGGLTRTYLVHMPSRSSVLRNASFSLPVVLNLHGFGSNARNQAAYSRLPEKAEEEGFVLVTPDGAGTPQQWNNAQLPSGVDDVAFIGELLDHLEATLCIDPARIYAAGISNGAAFSSRLACNMPDRIAGIALIAALIYPIVCDSDSPTPIIAFHGTADACVPYEGGTTACGRGALPVQPVETYAAQWAAHNGCDPTPARTQLTENVRTIAYNDCDENTAVLLYTVEGGGHTWPGSIDVPRLGPVTDEIDATDLLWEFFEAQAP